MEARERAVESGGIGVAGGGMTKCGWDLANEVNG
jgi:hypothetical protein